MQDFIRPLVLAALLAVSGSLKAQSQLVPAPQNVAQLSASGSVEVVQDLLSITLSATREGPDAAAVQTQLKTALDAALTEARKQVVAGQLDVRTGQFSLYPRYSREGKISNWVGSAELVLEGRDFARISATAGRIQGLAVTQTHFSLSREQRERVEGEAQALAINRFKARAADIAKGFGFAGFSLREVAVNSNDQGGFPRPRMMAMEAAAAPPAAPVPVEAGRTTVQVTVSGSIQMR